MFRASRFAALALLLPVLQESLQAQQTGRRLEAIRITGATACARDADAGTIGTVWAAAREALGDARRAAAMSPPTIQALRRVRELDAFGRIVMATDDTIVARTAELFQTLPPDVLSRDGYLLAMDGPDLLFAPDAGTLLSDAFARDHCFRLVADPRAPEALGLHFAPLPTREQVDIAGIFWLDRETSHLLRVEFTYVNLDASLAPAQAGGSLSFGAWENGIRGITTWEVRTPRLGLRERRTAQTTEREEHLDGIRIEGASISDLKAVPSGLPKAIGRIEGRVRDASHPSGGLSGARVTALGTGRAVRSDSAGRFALDRVPAGDVTLRVDHERLRLFGVDGRRTLYLPADSTIHVDVAVPSGAAAYAQLCPHSAGADTRAALVVRVLDGTLDVGVPSAAALATWRGRTLPTFLRSGAVRASSDEIGHVALCDLNASVRITLTVLARGFRQSVTSLAARGGVTEREVRLVPCRPEDPPSICPER